MIYLFMNKSGYAIKIHFLACMILVAGCVNFLKTPDISPAKTTQNLTPQMKDPIIGYWAFSSSGNQTGLTKGIQFNKDGTFNQHSEYCGGDSSGHWCKGLEPISGTWKIEGDGKYLLTDVYGRSEIWFFSSSQNTIFPEGRQSEIFSR